MTHNYFVKCPICGTITRMRTPVGYIYKTPVRFHCGECDSLLTGEFITDNEKVTVKYVPLNCEEVDPQDCEYFGEASGEMLCSKINAFHATGPDIMQLPHGRVSPVFDFMNSIPEDDRIRFINYACYSNTMAYSWYTHKIKYDLFLKGKQALLEKNYAEEMKRLHCQLGTDMGLLQFGYRSLFYDLGGLFKRAELVSTLTSLNYRFSHMNKASLNNHLIVLKASNRLHAVQEKLFRIMFDFWGVVCHLIPAIGLLYYRNLNGIDRTVQGISTCSFEDIKTFYQNTYESLLDCCDIVVGLDNLENRGDCNTFKNKLDLSKFRSQPKGNRMQLLDASEFFTGVFNLPVSSSSLRNAIGHSDYEYNGTKQEIRYPEKTGSTVILTSHLVDVALECCNMMRSVYVLAFIVYELSRYKLRTGDEPMLMHPIMYNKVKSQSRCPCGSGKKFRNCCRPLVDSHYVGDNDFDYPMKAEFNRPSIDDPYWRLRHTSKKWVT